MHDVPLKWNLRTALLGVVPSRAEDKASLNEQEAVSIATDAYIYGYSLITTYVTKYQ